MPENQDTVKFSIFLEFSDSKSLKALKVAYFGESITNCMPCPIRHVCMFFFASFVACIYLSQPYICSELVIVVPNMSCSSLKPAFVHCFVAKRISVVGWPGDVPLHSWTSTCLLMFCFCLTHVISKLHFHSGSAKLWPRARSQEEPPGDPADGWCPWEMIYTWCFCTHHGYHFKGRYSDDLANTNQTWWLIVIVTFNGDMLLDIHGIWMNGILDMDLGHGDLAIKYPLNMMLCITIA